MKRESFYLYKLQIESKVVQKAMADSVINGVYCLNITQNFWLLWLLWCRLEQFTVETPLIFLTAEISQQITVMLEAFTVTLTACTQISL